MNIIKTWPLLLAITISVSGCFESDQAKLDKALGLYTESTNNQEAISKALPLFIELSDKGNIQAQYMLATMYIRGDGVMISNDKALKLLLSASARGSGDASFLASQFYSEARYSQPLDPSKAKMLLMKSARDGSEIGQLTLGKAYLKGKSGFSKSINDAYDKFIKIGDGPYRLPASHSLYEIYSTPNQPLFSPEKATAEMERIWAKNKNLAFAGTLALIYSGKQFGDKTKSVKSTEKFNELIVDLEKQNRPQAVAMVKIGLGLVPGDQIMPMLLQAVKVDPMEEAFGMVFCTVMSSSYLSQSSESGLDQDDLIKSCMPEAQHNKNGPQLTVAAAYKKKMMFHDAYKWAYISYLNGNKQAFGFAEAIAAANFGGNVNDIDKEAIEARAGYASASGTNSASEAFEYSLPWYTASSVAESK